MVFRNFRGTNFFFSRTPTGQERWFSGILAVDLMKFHRKTAEAENSPLGKKRCPLEHENFVRSKNLFSYRGEKKKKSLSFGKKKFFFSWKNKMLLRKKTCRLKKKCQSENFPCQKRTCPECPEFSVMQDQKTAEAGKKRPRAYRGGKKKKRFVVGWKNKMLVGRKTCRLKKKCWLDNFPCQKRTCPECPEFPGMQHRKTAEAGKRTT